MGRRTIVQDDISGVELIDAVEATTITVDGTKYEVDLGPATKEHIIRWLSGEGAYNWRTAEPATRVRRSSSKGVGKGGSTVDTYGYPIAEVRVWAKKNKVLNGEGGSVVGDRGRISQSVYDAYKAAQ